MKRINNAMFLLAVALLAIAFSGCPMGTPTPDGTLVGPCDTAGDTRACSNDCSSGIQLCSTERNADGTRGTRLVWSVCEGTIECVSDAGSVTDFGPVRDAGTDMDSGSDIDAGTEVDGGTPSMCMCETRFCLNDCDILGQRPCADGRPDVTRCNPYLNLPGDACTEPTIPLATDVECVAGGCVPEPCDVACDGTADGLRLCSGGALNRFCTPFAPCGSIDVDAGTPPIDAGTDSGPPDLGPADAGMSTRCPDGPVRLCSNACGISGLAGVQLCDPAVGYGACVPPGTGCAVEPPTGFVCPPVGADGDLVLVCLTPCRRIGWQTVTDYCQDDSCHSLPLRPETCVLTDAGPPPVDAGPRDAGRDLGTDAGPRDAGPRDAGRDLGTDAGPPPVVDAGPRDLGPPDLGPPDLGPPDMGPPDAGPMSTSTGFEVTLSPAAQARCAPAGFVTATFNSAGERRQSAPGEMLHVDASEFDSFGHIPTTAICTPAGYARQYYGLTASERLALLGLPVTAWDPAILVMLFGDNVTANTYFCWDEAYMQSRIGLGVPRSRWNADYVRMTTSLDYPLTGCPGLTGP